MKSMISRLGIVVVAAAMLFGCATQANRQSSSVVAYLYPEKTDHVETASIPVLPLPLKVGVAFVPENPMQRHWTGGQTFRPNTNPNSISEKEKLALMQEISRNFQEYPFVNKSIELIPSQYLSPGGSFTNLDQIRSMFGIDVIALISYDQSQFTDENFMSITYWTLVGAYIFKGEKNDTNTMMDTAVYHIDSRKMLFRAPGISRIQGTSTPVNLSEQLRLDSQKGFSEAATNMVSSLKDQLEVFKEKVKASPDEYKVVHRPGYTGGGSLSAFPAVIVIAAGGYLLWSGRNRR